MTKCKKKNAHNHHSTPSPPPEIKTYERTCTPTQRTKQQPSYASGGSKRPRTLTTIIVTPKMQLARMATEKSSFICITPPTSPAALLNGKESVAGCCGGGALARRWREKSFLPPPPANTLLGKYCAKIKAEETECHHPKTTNNNDNNDDELLVSKNRSDRLHALQRVFIPICSYFKARPETAFLASQIHSHATASTTKLKPQTHKTQQRYKLVAILLAFKMNEGRELCIQTLCKQMHAYQDTVRLCLQGERRVLCALDWRLSSFMLPNNVAYAFLDYIMDGVGVDPKHNHNRETLNRQAKDNIAKITLVNYYRLHADCTITRMAAKYSMWRLLAYALAHALSTHDCCKDVVSEDGYWLWVVVGILFGGGDSVWRQHVYAQYNEIVNILPQIQEVDLDQECQ